jgi:hypothetical protein
MHAGGFRIFLLCLSLVILSPVYADSFTENCGACQCNTTFVNNVRISRIIISCTISDTIDLQNEEITDVLDANIFANVETL